VDRVTASVEQIHDADLIVLPELWAHGGFATDQWKDRAEPITGPTFTRITEAAVKAGAWLHAGSIIERAERGTDLGPQRRGMWNTSLLIDPDGRQRLTYRKIHRFGLGFGDGEPRLLEAGDTLATTALSVRDATVTVGLATCYDLRFPELFRGLLDAGSEVVIVPAAWPAPRIEHWRLLGRARATENQFWMIQANTAGTHSGVEMGGFSQIVSPTGEVVAQLGLHEGILRAEIDLDLVTNTRAAFPVLADRRLFTQAHRTDHADT
jgi:predicted amidohydrolase